MKKLEKDLSIGGELEEFQRKEKIIDLPIPSSPESIFIALQDGLQISLSSVKYDVVQLKKLAFDILKELNHKNTEEKGARERGYYG